MLVVAQVLLQSAGRNVTYPRYATICRNHPALAGSQPEQQQRKAHGVPERQQQIAHGVPRPLLPQWPVLAAATHASKGILIAAHARPLAGSRRQQTARAVSRGAVYVEAFWSFATAGHGQHIDSIQAHEQVVADTLDVSRRAARSSGASRPAASASTEEWRDAHAALAYVGCREQDR